MPQVALRLLAALLIVAVPLVRQGADAGQVRAAAGAAGEVLVLSELDLAYDQNVMDTLDRVLTLEGGSTHYSVKRHQIDASASEAQALGEVRKLLAMRPWRLIITTSAWPATLVRSAGTDVPMLFRSADDPVRMCVVDSLRKPGQHTTGFTSYVASEAKMIEALRLSYASLRSVVIIYDGSNVSPYPSCHEAIRQIPCRPGFVDDAEERTWLLSRVTDLVAVERAARLAHLPWRLLRVCTPEDVKRLTTWLPYTPVDQLPRDAVVVPYHDLFYSHAQTVVAQLNERRLPAIYGAPYFLSLGGLMAMGQHREPVGAAWGIDLAPRILAGEAAGGIPIQRPEGEELLVNLATAKRLGMPPSKAALRAADRLIR